MSRTTPEGRIKDAVKTYLRDIGLCASKDAVNVSKKPHTGWFHMPVQAFHGVMGQPDFHGHYKGRFFSIETKKDLKTDPTPLQQHQITAINTTGAGAFVVRCVEDLAYIETWRKKIDEEVKFLTRR
jgi:penicillin-binding protein-related factor A (putative recombinase)